MLLQLMNFYDTNIYIENRKKIDKHETHTYAQAFAQRLKQLRVKESLLSIDHSHG